MSCDVKLVGGQVIDGSGSPAVRADVAVKGGVISALGDLAGVEGATVLDCAGKIITPGFIDIHSHSDWLLPGADHGALVEPFIRQGMTSLVGGNCGFSPAPVTEINRAAAEEASRLIIDDAIDLRWKSMAEFLDGLEKGGCRSTWCNLSVTVRCAPASPVRSTMLHPRSTSFARWRR
jgi:N-acyl-D-amino-acid deacylase